VRFIGDRSIQEKDFGRIRIDRIAEMQKWADNLKNLQEDQRVKQSVIAANNHYAGFGPGTTNVFRNMLGLSDAKWEDKATVGLLAAAFLVAAAITVPNSAFAVQRIVGAPQSQAAAQQANNNGLAGVNAAVGVQAQVGQVCVNALNSAPSC
jgi:hypothetical protein